MPGNFQWQVPFTFAMWLICNCNLPSKIDLAKMLGVFILPCLVQMNSWFCYLKQNAAKLVKPEIRSNNSPSSSFCLWSKDVPDGTRKLLFPGCGIFVPFHRDRWSELWSINALPLAGCSNTVFFIQWWWQLGLILISLTLRNSVVWENNNNKKSCISHFFLL